MGLFVMAFARWRDGAGPVREQKNLGSLLQEEGAAVQC